MLPPPEISPVTIKPGQRSQNAAIVDTRVDEEAAVFRRNKSVYDMLWYVVVGDRNAPPLADLAYKVSVAAENPQGHLEPNVTNGLRGGQAWRSIVISADDAGDTTYKQQAACARQQNQSAENALTHRFTHEYIR